MNSIILDKTDADVAKAVEGCEVGKPQTFTITATPVSDSDTLLVAKVDAIEYQEEPGEETPAEDEGEPVTEKAYKPRARKGSATAVEPMME